MLAGVIKDSIASCFCDGCSSTPALSAVKGTDLRCRGSGGVAYEVVLSRPQTHLPSHVITSAPPRVTVSADDIKERLQAAQRRKKDIETRLQESVSERLARAEQSRREQEQREQQLAQEQLEHKLSQQQHKRQIVIKGVVDRAKEQLDQVELVQLKSRQQSTELAATIELKQKGAEQLRDENLRKMLEKFREREERREKVRSTHMEHLQQLKANLADWEVRLETAAQRRDTETLRELEALRQHNEERVRDVKQKAEAHAQQRAEQTASELPEKLQAAERRRQLNLGSVAEKAREELDKVPAARSNMEEAVRAQEARVLAQVQQKLHQAEARRQKNMHKHRQTSN